MNSHGLINLGLLPRLLEAMEAAVGKSSKGPRPPEQPGEGSMGRVAHPGLSEAH